MNKKAKIISLFVFTGLTVFFAFSMSSSVSISAEQSVQKNKTLEDLLEKRKRYFTPSSTYVPDRLVNILIVPGHDDEYSGAVFGDVKEVELNREVSLRLYEYLSKEPGFNPILAHEGNQYSYFLAHAFATYRTDIENFMKQSVSEFSKKQKEQDIEMEDPGFHNTALPEVRLRLHGINWWANQNNIDFIIHIHFNDYRGRTGTRAGEYDGFSIYVSGEHFENHELSRTFGDSIFEEVKKIRPVSNLPFEESGVIEGHELIAIGPNDSLRAGSVLIEYGYIYEDLFQDKNKKDITFDYLAYTTYAGIKKALNEMPFQKQYVELKTTPDKTTQDNLLWQFQNALLGTYPPQGKTLRECPITGFLGECSKEVE